MKIFKVLSVLMFVALSAGFASCSDDDDNGVTADKLVGTWEPTFTEGWVKMSDYPNGNRDWKGTWSENKEESDAGKRIVFNEDKTGIFTYDWEGMTSADEVTEVSVNFTWSNENGILKFEVKDDEDDSEVGDDYTEEMKVVELTATTAVIETRTSYPSEGGYSSYSKDTYTRVK